MEVGHMSLDSLADMSDVTQECEIGVGVGVEVEPYLENVEFNFAVN